MLTKAQLDEVRDIAESPEDVILMLVNEIKAQRAVMIAALHCNWRGRL